MIHVALFSFQRTTLSFEARFRLKGFASSDSFIVPHLFQTVKNFFIFLFAVCSGFFLPHKSAYLGYHIHSPLSRTFLSFWCRYLMCAFLFRKQRRRRDLNPRAATNDLLPFQGSPFGQLGYFSIKNGEGGIRTHAPFRTNGFQDRLVMTTSIPLHNT